jgi:hypothetical protein
MTRTPVNIEPRQVQIFLADGSSEDLLVTPLGGKLYRLKESFLLGDARYHDVIEAEPGKETGLQMLRIVSRSGLSVITKILSKEFINSSELAALLEKIMSVGGNWESAFGGMLILRLPPENEASILRELEGLARQRVSAMRNLDSE